MKRIKTISSRLLQAIPTALVVITLTLGPATHISRAEAPAKDDVTVDSSKLPSTDNFHFEGLSKKEMKVQAAKIDAYFAKYDMPLSGHGMDFVKAAKENDIPSTFMAAISIVETTGGKHMCKNTDAENNPFGYGSCKDGFEYKSLTDAINQLSAHIGGNKEKTAKYYKDKDIDVVLKRYNSVIPTYASKVKKYMKLINEQELPAEE